jgi:hypothetical protein
MQSHRTKLQSKKPDNDDDDGSSQERRKSSNKNEIRSVENGVNTNRERKGREKGEKRERKESAYRKREL